MIVALEDDGRMVRRNRPPRLKGRCRRCFRGRNAWERAHHRLVVSNHGIVHASTPDGRTWCGIDTASGWWWRV